MNLTIEHAYLIGNIFLFIPWLIIFITRRDIRKEILLMSTLVGLVSVATGYYWWTKDWWQPDTITQTIVGLEDFLIGFTSGGIMASIYEFVFRRRFDPKKIKRDYPSGLTIALLVFSIAGFLFWGVGLTSFISSTIALSVVYCVMIFYRRDLAFDGLISGIGMVIISLLFYLPIIILFPNWVNETYLFHGLSGVLIYGIPVEEFIFWFLAGLAFGPFYEYAKHRKMASR